MNLSKRSQNIPRKWLFAFVLLVLLVLPVLAWAHNQNSERTTPPPPSRIPRRLAEEQRQRSPIQQQRQQPQGQLERQQPSIEQRRQQPPVEQQRQRPPVQQQREQPPVEQHRQRPPVQQERQQPPIQQQRQQPQGQLERQQPSIEQRRQQPPVLPQRQQPQRWEQRQQPPSQPQRQQPSVEQQRQQPPSTLPPSESRQHIQELNRSRTAMQGINRRPLPERQVTVHTDGRQTIKTTDGREIAVRRDGTVERVSLPGNRTVTFRSDGNVRSVRTDGMQINHGLHGGRTIVTERNSYRLVSMGPHGGYLQRDYWPHGRRHIWPNGRTYVQRTYVFNNVIYTRVYRRHYYRGVHYYRYVPLYYYHPVFYGWVYNPWRVSVYFTWGWYGEPWYAYYGPYFAPYPVYYAPYFWLVDFLLAENLRLAYEARVCCDAAAAQAQASASAAQPTAGCATALTPEVKQAIAEEVKRALEAEQQAASASPQEAAPRGEEVLPALDPAHRVFIVSGSLDVTSSDGRECSLTPGDVIARLSDTPDENQNVTVTVLSSKPGDCPPGSQVAVSVQDLQEMYNRFREQLDAGLKALADNQGKGGLPAAPDTSTLPGEVPPPTPDANVAGALRDQQKQADQIEKDVRQKALESVPQKQGSQGSQGQTAAQAVPPEPQTVQLGQTPEQVKTVLGQPEKIIELGSKLIYVYKNLKVTFVNGKVTDVQ